MNYPQGKPRTYVPEHGGNRARPSSLQVSVEIQTPTERDRRAIQASMTVAAGKALGPLGEAKEGTPEYDAAMVALAGAIARAASWKEHTVSRHVLSIARYSVRGQDVRTGAELAEYGETEMLDEVASEILAETSLTEGEAEPSAGPSDSSGAANSTGGSGSAGAVEPPASTTPGAVA